MLTGMPVKDYPIEKVEYGLLRLCFKREHIVIAQGNTQFLSLINKECDVSHVGEENLLRYWNVGQVIELETDKEIAEEGEESPEEDNAVDKSPSKKKKKKARNTVMWVELVNPYCKNRSLKGKPIIPNPNLTLN